MKIAILGAGGAVGSAVAAEAARRGHRVTAAGRHRLPARPGAGIAYCRADASDPAEVLAMAEAHDVIVSATRPRRGSEHELVAVARAVLGAAARSGCRALLVGGAATLRVPDGARRQVLDDPRYLAPAVRPIAEACAAQLGLCLTEATADWTYLSPPAQLVPGERTGVYRVASDDLIVDAHGRSCISTADLAAALVDEIDDPRHRRRRFTVAY